MSTTIISEHCTTKPGLVMRLIGLVEVTPNHAKCKGSHVIPGVLGGTVCSCACHKVSAPANSPQNSSALS